MRCQENEMTEKLDVGKTAQKVSHFSDRNCDENLRCRKDETPPLSI